MQYWYRSAAKQHHYTAYILWEGFDQVLEFGR